MYSTQKCINKQQYLPTFNIAFLYLQDIVEFSFSLIRLNWLAKMNQNYMLIFIFKFLANNCRYIMMNILYFAHRCLLLLVILL